MAVNPYNNEETNTVGGIGSVKNISDALKKVNGSINGTGTNENNENVGNKATSSVYSKFSTESTTGSNTSTFKVASANLPEKTSFWTKLKNALFYEVKIELTPYQQKIEDEINDFLHQEITWKSLKEAALSEVPITFRGKRVF